MERQANRLRALAESSQMFAEASTDLPRLLGVVARRFSELIGEAANIRLIEGEALVPVATHHPDPEIAAYLKDYHDETPLRLGEGISGHVIATGEPYYMPELDLEQLKQRLAPRFIPIFERVGITGMMVVRLRARGINLGYLSLFRTSAARPPYTRDDLLLVQDLADRAALAIDTSQLVDGLERRVAERTQALETANLELEAFAYSVSHDLRSPLRAIDGYSRLLQDRMQAQTDDRQGAQPDAEGRRLLDVIRRKAQHMSHLIEELLRLSRLGHRAIQPVAEIDMREVVETVVSGIRAANPSLVLDLRLGDLPPAVGNVELLRQVWTNLLDNAIQALGETGTITISTSREGPCVRVDIADDGPGIEPAVRERIFEPFFTTKDVGQGTGLGLDTARRIVRDRNRGSIDVASEPGRTVFHVRLPVQSALPSTQASEGGQAA